MKLNKKQALHYRTLIERGSQTLTDDDAYTTPLLFPRWQTDHTYNIGDRVSYITTEAGLYKCLQDHISQDDWTPDVAVSLWTKIADPSQEWPEWIQPTGAHDAYSKGDKVSHQNKHWISDVDNNTWEPGIYGWTEA